MGGIYEPLTGIQGSGGVPVVSVSPPPGGAYFRPLFKGATLANRYLPTVRMLDANGSMSQGYTTPISSNNSNIVPALTGTVDSANPPYKSDVNDAYGTIKTAGLVTVSLVAIELAVCASVAAADNVCDGVMFQTTPDNGATWADALFMDLTADRPNTWATKAGANGTEYYKVFNFPASGVYPSNARVAYNKATDKLMKYTAAGVWQVIG